jgi:hypothetical protein
LSGPKHSAIPDAILVGAHPAHARRLRAILTARTAAEVLRFGEQESRSEGRPRAARGARPNTVNYPNRVGR